MSWIRFAIGLLVLTLGSRVARAGLSELLSKITDSSKSR
jgi:hypothetical protein